MQEAQDLEKSNSLWKDMKYKYMRCRGWFKKIWKKDLLLFVILILCSLSLLIGFYILAYNQGIDSLRRKNDTEQPIINFVPNRNVKIDANLFAEVLKTISSRYYDKSKLDSEKLMEGAIKGMVNSLEDPFSEFLNAKDLEELNTELKGSFEGIGAEVGKKEDKIVIVAPLANTPAERAGIKPQDQVVEVDGVSTYNMTTNDVVLKIRGKKGSTVVLTIMRNSWDKPQKISIVRDTINVPSASVEILPDGIALLKIYNFYEPLSEQFAKAVKAVEQNKVKGIIVDLRNNPGGYLDVYREIGNYFFKKGSLLLIEDYKGARENTEYRAFKDGELKGIPIIVLINGGTASASEILAGALRDNRGVKLIGEISFGKGSVQELLNLSGGNQIKLTIAHWLTPKGFDIHKKGLKPDIVVEPNKEMENSASYGTSSLEKDNQLKKAYDELIKIIK